MGSSHQPGILDPIPAAARFVSFELRAGAARADLWGRLAAAEHDPKTVVGIATPASAPRSSRAAATVSTAAASWRSNAGSTISRWSSG